LCHAGLGVKPNPIDKLTESDFNNIDCLICHAPDYKRSVAKEGNIFKLVPAQGVDVIKAAQNVLRPTNEMCLRCHTAAGGGPNHKHGVIPTKSSDIHISKGLVCVDCHTTKEHKIAGGADIKAQELLDVKVACENCHKDNPHKGKQASDLNTHSKRLACQTCHIPTIARDPQMPTVVERDWTKPVLNEKTGLYGPTNKFATNVKPEYQWWNRMMTVRMEPVGSINDQKAKIYPWKRTVYTDIADAVNNKPISIKAGVYAVTGDPAAAAKKGAEDANQNYSGQWKGSKETLFFSLNHQIASKKEALKCNSCHNVESILDFNALGYTEERIKNLKKNR
jgi:hypothetical protein